MRGDRDRHDDDRQRPQGAAGDAPRTRPIVQAADAHRGPRQRPGIDHEQPDEADVDERLDGDRRERPIGPVERDAERAPSGTPDDDAGEREIGIDGREDEERRRALVRQRRPVARALDALRPGAARSGRPTAATAPTSRSIAARRRLSRRNLTTISPSPTSAEPADHEQRRARASLDRERRRRPGRDPARLRSAPEA